MRCPKHKGVAWQAFGAEPMPCFVCDPARWLENPPGGLPLDSSHNKTTDDDVESLVRAMLLRRVGVTA